MIENEPKELFTVYIDGSTGSIEIKFVEGPISGGVIRRVLKCISVRYRQHMKTWRIKQKTRNIIERNEENAKPRPTARNDASDSESGQSDGPITETDASEQGKSKQEHFNAIQKAIGNIGRRSRGA